MIVLAALGGFRGFASKWAQTTAVTPTLHDITGAWQGTWSSEATGHGDALRCLITRVDENTYSAHFHARFMKFLSGQYTTILHVTPLDGAWRFKGESNLGWLGGGVYKQEGEIRNGTYEARYESEHDRGVMRMSRPEARPEK